MPRRGYGSAFGEALLYRLEAVSFLRVLTLEGCLPGKTNSHRPHGRLLRPFSLEGNFPSGRLSRGDIMVNPSEDLLYLRPSPHPMLRRHFHGLDISVEVEVEVLTRQVRYGWFDAHDCFRLNGRRRWQATYGVEAQQMLSTHWRRSICRGRCRSEYTMTMMLASDQLPAESASYDRLEVVRQRCVTVLTLLLLHRVSATGVSEATCSSTSLG